MNIITNVKYRVSVYGSLCRVRQRSGASLLPVIIAVQLLVVGALLLARPYLMSHMRVDKSAVAQNVANVAERSQLHTQQQRAARRQKKVSKHDIEKLKQAVRKKNNNKIRKQIEKMNEVRQELQTKKQEKLQLLKTEAMQRAQQSLLAAIKSACAQLQEQAADIDEHSEADEAARLYKQAKKMHKHAQQLPDQEVATLEPQLAMPASQALEKLQELSASAATEAQHLEELQKNIEDNGRLQKKYGGVYLTKQYREGLVTLSAQLEQLKQRQSGNYKDSDQDQQQREKIDELMNDQGLRLDPDTLAQMDIDQLYGVAKQLEQEMASDYAAIRAADLANVQHKDFSASFDAIAKNLPQRADFDFAKMGAGLETLGDLEDYRGKLDGVADELRQMWENTQNMQHQALGTSETKSGADAASQQRLQQQLAAQQAITQAAQRQTGRSTVLDMSEQMRQSYQIGAENKRSQATAGNHNEGGGLTAKRSIEEKRMHINTSKIKAEALPGRKFTDASSRRGWLYIDTWYVIGPWAAKFKASTTLSSKDRDVNWDALYPPEYEIDLSKTYMGKNKKQLQWNFIQSNTLRINPPDEEKNATYYAYTEVHFDKAQDMLLAIASDDAAKVWVNDILVWQDNGLSSWSLDEGFRKVAFKAGFNKILVRIVNGPGVCRYSLLLCPPGIE